MDFWKTPIVSAIDYWSRLIGKTDQSFYLYMYFWLNKCSLGKHKHFLSKQHTVYVDLLFNYHNYMLFNYYKVFYFWIFTPLSSIVTHVARLKMQHCTVLWIVCRHISERQLICLARRDHLEHVWCLKHENAMASDRCSQSSNTHFTLIRNIPLCLSLSLYTLQLLTRSCASARFGGFNFTPCKSFD